MAGAICYAPADEGGTETTLVEAVIEQATEAAVASVVAVEAKQDADSALAVAKHAEILVEQGEEAWRVSINAVETRLAQLEALQLELREMLTQHHERTEKISSQLTELSTLIAELEIVEEEETVTEPSTQTAVSSPSVNTENEPPKGRKTARM